MNENEGKIHYRKAFSSPYLSSADIVAPTVLTINHVLLEVDKSKKTKDLFNTAYFSEKEIRQGEALKPMILNATNSRILKELSGSHFIDDWQGIKVTIYVDENVRFRGDTVEGLRISPQPPVIRKPEITPESPKWQSAVDAYKRDGNLDSVKKRAEISPENEKLLIEKANGVD